MRESQEKYTCISLGLEQIPGYTYHGLDKGK